MISLAGYRKRFTKKKKTRVRVSEKKVARQQACRAHQSRVMAFTQKLDDILDVRVKKYNGYYFMRKRYLLDLKRLINANQDIITIEDIALLLEALGKIEEGRHKYIIESIVNRVFDSLGCLLSNNYACSSATFGEWVSIVEALPKLSVCHSDYQKLYKDIFKKVGFISSVPGGFLPYDRFCATVLNSFARLGLEPEQHEDLIMQMLAIFFNLTSANVSVLIHLWEFVLYAKSKDFKGDMLEPLFKKVHAKINSAEKKEPTVSNSQRLVFESLKKHLKPKYSSSLMLEYQVGPYSLDLALQEEKVNIEIDGPHHRRLGDLTPKDQLRDVLLARADWHVIRLPITSFFEMGKRKEFSEYSAAALQEIFHLFKC